MVNKRKWEINVYTTDNNKGRKVYKNDGECKIDRMRLPDPGKNFLSRIFSYLTFAIRTFISLILFRPHAILYYESISAGPVYFYMSLIRKHIPLLIHYHEYCSPDW